MTFAGSLSTHRHILCNSMDLYYISNLILASWCGALGGLRADLASRSGGKEDTDYLCVVLQGDLLYSAAGLGFTQSPILLQKCCYPWHPSSILTACSCWPSNSIPACLCNATVFLLIVSPLLPLICFIFCCWAQSCVHTAAKASPCYTCLFTCKLAWITDTSDSARSCRQFFRALFQQHHCFPFDQCVLWSYNLSLFLYI